MGFIRIWHCLQPCIYTPIPTFYFGLFRPVIRLSFFMIGNTGFSASTVEAGFATMKSIVYT